MNENQQPQQQQITHAQAYQVLVAVSDLPFLKLSKAEMFTVIAALQVFKALVDAQPQEPNLTVAVPADTTS